MNCGLDLARSSGVSREPQANMALGSALKTRSRFWGRALSRTTTKLCVERASSLRQAWPCRFGWFIGVRLVIYGISR